VVDDLAISGIPLEWLAPAVAALLALAAEALHARRVRRVAALAFGPRARPAPWVRAAPALRVASLAALAWGLAALLVLEPTRRSLDPAAAMSRAGQEKHVLLVLDVSPSMRLADAGPSKKQSRMQRARDVMESFFARVPFASYRVSVVAVYNGAKAVVVDTRDFEVVRNILGDLPMEWAFESGKTNLFAGLEEAAKIAKPWNPKSTLLVVVSDGDTVPAKGMPAMPASVASTIVVGVGDAVTGKFIDGRHSRQDVSTLRQIAARLHGAFHDGNEKQLPTSLIAEAAGEGEEAALAKLTKREYALLACAVASALLALLPWLLHFLGTRFTPGAPRREEGAPERRALRESRALAGSIMS